MAEGRGAVLVCSFLKKVEERRGEERKRNYSVSCMQKTTKNCPSLTS
jgi:hypothetical protein